MTAHRVEELLTPADVAKALRVKKLETIYRLISRGKIRAVDVSTGTGRPRWRIPPEALRAFLRDRAVSPPASEAPRKRKAATTVATQYF